MLRIKSLVLLFVVSTNLSAASITYDFSGTLTSTYDANLNLDVLNADYIYPVGVDIGTAFSASLTLNDDLGALNGTLDFDIGGLYYGHKNLSGAATVCDDNSCTRFGDYDDPTRTIIYDVTLSEQTTLVDTNMPLSDTNILGSWLTISVDQDTTKPERSTLLSDLPISSINFHIWSMYEYDAMVDCPACVEGYTYVPVGQGWDLSGVSAELTAVPVPTAAWLFGSGLIGLAGFAKRKKA